MKNLVKIFKKYEPKALDDFRKVDDVLISYNDLERIPLDVKQVMKRDMPDAIEFTRITSPNPDSLMFTVTMKKGQVWEMHHHDCKETILVFSGDIQEVISGDKACRAETITVPPYTRHYVIANKDSIFYVEFLKPKKK